MTKNTYGTGSFVLVNLGDSHPPPVDGLLTTVAWQLGEATTYAMEGVDLRHRRRGAVAARRARHHRRRRRKPDRSPRACPTPTASCSCPRSPGSARRTSTRTRAARSFGLTRGTTRAHLARAVVEAMAWQTADVIDAITAAAGIPLTELRVDGGASAMDVLCQFQADVLGVTVRRPVATETTVLGAASLAGIAEGVWASPAEAASAWREDAAFLPPRSPRPRTAGRLASRRRPGPQLGRSRRLMKRALDRMRPRTPTFGDGGAGGQRGSATVAPRSSSTSRTMWRSDQPSLGRARLMPRTAWLMRCSFSTSAKRTKPSPPGPNPTPGDTATLASCTSSLANSRLPSSS